MWNRNLIGSGVVSIFVALALAACGNKEPTYCVNQPGQGKKEKIDISIGFAAGAATRVTTDAAFESEWEGGDAVGLFAVERGTGLGPVGSAGNYIDNVKLICEGGDVWRASEELVWPEDGAPLDFYAYYPYDPEFDPADTDLAVPADQSGGYAVCDLMRAENNGGGAGLTSGDTVTLDFEHLLTMVQLTLDVSSIPGGSGAPPVVKLRGVEPDVTMYGEVGDDPDVYVCRAIVKPRTVGANTRMFDIELPDGRVFVSEPTPGPVELRPGEVNKFSLSLL